ncbi:MAG: tyrosine-protein phosphatase [Bdellovibrionota bacterium]
MKLQFFIKLLMVVVGLSLAQTSFATIPRFIKLDNGFYRGGQPGTYNDYVRLKNLGIKTIINLRAAPEISALEKSIAQNLGMNYINIPFSTFDYPSSEKIASVMKRVTNPNLRPVFLHCRHGKDRTGIVGILYRVQEQNWPVQKAYDEALNLNLRWYLPNVPMLIYRETGVWPKAMK